MIHHNIKCRFRIKIWYFLTFVSRILPPMLLNQIKSSDMHKNYIEIKYSFQLCHLYSFNCYMKYLTLVCLSFNYALAMNKSFNMHFEYTVHYNMIHMKYFISWIYDQWPHTRYRKMNFYKHICIFYLFYQFGYLSIDIFLICPCLELISNYDVPWLWT